MSEWISVKEKLPKDEFPHYEPSPSVLVSYPWGIKVGCQFNCGVWVDDEIREIYGVTHWMPLPEPPKKEL